MVSTPDCSGTVLEKIPVLSKTSSVFLVPKTAHAKEPNDYRPVALTFHLMKNMERLILSKPPQCGKHSKRATVISLQAEHQLHRLLTSLETAGTVLRVMFCQFSCTFNTIHPAILQGKLVGAGMDGHLTAQWTTIPTGHST